MFLFLNNEKTKYVQLQDSIISQITGLDTLYFYSFNFKLNNTTAGTRLKNVECVSNNKQTDLYTLINGQPRFIYRYTELHCSACVELAMEELNNLFGNSPEKIILLTSHTSDRNFSVFKIVNEIQFPAYKINFDSFDWLPEKLNNPYCFILHPDMRVSEVYMPDKNLSELNHSYFKKIKQLLSD
jgi:hypothetical protein